MGYRKISTELRIPAVSTISPRMVNGLLGKCSKTHSQPVQKFRRTCSKQGKLLQVLVNLVISNEYCFSDACCGVPGSTLYLELVFMERRIFYAVLVVSFILAFDHFKKLVERIVKTNYSIKTAVKSCSKNITFEYNTPLQSLQNGM